MLNYTTANFIREYRSVCLKLHLMIMLLPSKFEGFETTVFAFFWSLFLKTNSSQILFHLLVFSKCNFELPDLKQRPFLNNCCLIICTFLRSMSSLNLNLKLLVFLFIKRFASSYILLRYRKYSQLS